LEDKEISFLTLGEEVLEGEPKSNFSLLIAPRCDVLDDENEAHSIVGIKELLNQVRHLFRTWGVAE
jgi:hypothetical protein